MSLWLIRKTHKGTDKLSLSLCQEVQKKVYKHSLWNHTA